MQKYSAGQFLSVFKILLVVLTLSVSTSGVLSAGQAPAAGQDLTQGPLPPLPPLPLSPTEKAEKDGTALRLTLKDVTKMALKNNLDIAIQDTNEVLSQQAIVQAYGQYDPSLTVGLGVQSQKSPNTNLATESSGGNYSTMDYANWNFGFQQNVRTGGNYSVQYNSNRTASDVGFFLFSPQYNTSVTLTFTQPLLRNLRIDQNRGQIKLASLDLKTSDSQFKAKVVDIIANIQGQYWDLAGAIRDYEIKRESVRLAQITLRDNTRKVEIGVLAAISVTEARATLAQREGDMIQAEEKIYDAENNLLTMISNDRKAEVWSQVIVPAETPAFQEYKIDYAAAIKSALTNRPELEQSDIAFRKDEVNQRLYEESHKWQFDLKGSFGTTGVAGPQTYITDPLTGQREVLIAPEMVGGIGIANKLLLTGGFTNWTVGFNIQVPIRNRTADAQLAQVKIQKQQELMKRKNLEQQIQAEIRSAAQKIETNRRLVESARAASAYAEEQLKGEQIRFDNGASETFRVLDRQENYAAAQAAELQALISYKKSIIAFEKAKYTLLESNDFATATRSHEDAPKFK
jgi:HAE1 family hydrophobic/amphiphilic exporter-1